ncbi:MAG: hypothetical protein ACRENK_15470 [Gemmatimonadaceae bacterium]
MRPALRVASVAALIAAPFFCLHAQNTGKTLAMDFRTTIAVQGAPDTGLIVGRALGTASTMRLDVSMNGASAHVSPIADSAVTIIVTDSGKTIAYLDAKKSQYLRVRPAEMIAQAQQMGGMKMDFSETNAKVDNLGAGPVLLGHPTTHYRVATGMTMTISAMGQQQVVKVSSTNDAFYATDIASDLNPFASLTGGDMANMFGTTNKDFADKMKAVQAKLPKAVPLRALSSSTLAAPGQTRITNSVAEVTSVKWIAADPKAFEIPASYSAVQLPGLGGAPSDGGAIPPK